MEPKNLTQNFANDLAQIDTATIEAATFVLTPQQQIYIDYKALGGLFLDQETHNFRKMTMAELGRLLQVDPRTLYNWRDAIPNFWERVATRRKELNAGEWLAKMHETWKLKAAKFDNWPITEAWLINFDPNYKTPKVKVEHEVGDNYAALLAAAAKDNVIDGEVITDVQAIHATGGTDQPPHPQAS